MKTQSIICALFTLALFVGHAQTQPRLGAPQDLLVVDQPKQPDKTKDKDKDKAKDKDKKDVVVPPDVFTQAIQPSFPTYFNPSMMGEWPAIYARQMLAVMGTQTVTKSSQGALATTTTTAVAQNRTAYVPVPTRGAFNIAENESPMPGDRVFTFWNYYSQLRPMGPRGQIITTNVVVTRPNRVVAAFFPVTTTTTTVTPPVQPVTLNREVFGFEKTFLNGFASIELRAPLLQQTNGNGGYGADNFGDLTIVGKYALIMDPNTGNVLSTGLALTVPSSRGITTADGTFKDTIIQPFIGYVWNLDRFFIQGFSSVAVPTDRDDVVIAFNDIGFNYWLYRNPDRFLTFVVPTFEVHVTTPLNHRHFAGPIFVPDSVGLTGGVHLGLGRYSTLTLGVATPATGPWPFRIESFVMLNVRF